MDSIIQEIVHEIAEQREVDRDELALSLEEHIDTDVLRDLDASFDTYRLDFAVPGHVVTVASGKPVEVSGSENLG